MGGGDRRDVYRFWMGKRQALTVNGKNRTANCQSSLFSKKNPIIRNSPHIMMARRPGLAHFCYFVILSVFCVPVLSLARVYFIIKPNSCTIFYQIYFWNKALHVSDSSSVQHQEIFTVHTAMVYVIQVC